MDRRSWPWKKKSSDKSDKSTAAGAAAAAADVGAAALASAASQGEGDKDNYKKPNNVQISVESYTHLTGLEEKVKSYEEQVRSLDDQIEELNEKLSAAQSEITTKENLVKQHAKVAEEAVSGWEKAEAEALALKNHLETVTLSKLTAQDRAAHLDGALKECMRQIRNLKEEYEQKLQDVALTKTKQMDKLRLEFEAKMGSFEQELLRSAAENDALSRSLQERSNMLIKMNEEKSQAEAEIEHLKGNIESCEREINSLKYELHVASKELEIRNEEKNMSVRSAEVANKQHMEGVKKIAKLEAECQRLRGLVRKKLPGPAALAQMKLEVESLGRDYVEPRLRRSPVKPSHHSSVSEISLEGAQKFHKETEFLTERLLAMEEETKMLKEALAKRNSELQASRNLCAKAASRLQSLEAQLHISNQEKNSLTSVVQVPVEGYSTHASQPPSLTSLSEDGNDDDRSCADSWATTLISDLPQIKKDKNSDKPTKVENGNHLELMDDFLEMEKLACQNENGVADIIDSPNTNVSEAMNSDASGQTQAQRDLDPPVTNKDTGSFADQSPLIKLQSRISKLLESVSKDADMEKILEDAKQIVLDAQDLHQNSVTSTSEEVPQDNASCSNPNSPEGGALTEENEIALSPNSKTDSKVVKKISKELENAISQIHEFVIFLGKEAMTVYDVSSDSNDLGQKIDEFSVTYNKVLSNNTSLDDFVNDLSNVLAKASELRFNVLGYKGTEVDINGPDCIDKVALPENKAIQKDPSGERYQNGCAHISSPTSNPEVPDDGNLIPGYRTEVTSCKVSLEEFEELKLEKDNVAMDLARCIENLEMTKSQLHETEQLLAEAKSQLASSQKSNSLAETQLKCMAESYRSLETRAQELETEFNVLLAKTEALENELAEEKQSHEGALTRCKELQEQLQLNESCPVCSSADADLKTKQDKELAAAAEKLAECQETILLLGKQFKSLRPQSEFTGSPHSERSQRGEAYSEDEPTTTSGGGNLQNLDPADMETASSANSRRLDTESPPDPYDHPHNPSDNEANLLRSPVNSNNSKHRSTRSTSITLNPEKHQRGFSRFFSSKGKNGY